MKLRGEYGAISDLTALYGSKWSETYDADCSDQTDRPSEGNHRDHLLRETPSRDNVSSPRPTAYGLSVSAYPVFGFRKESGAKVGAGD